MTILRTCSETEELGGGRFHHTQHLRPIAYLRNGAMRRMGWRYSASGDVNMPLGTDEGMLVRFDHRIKGKSPLWEVRAPDRSKLVRFALLGANNVAAQKVSDSEYVYPNALNGADLALVYAGHYVAADVRLRAGHPRVVSWRLDAQSGFDPATLTLGDMSIRQPVLVPPEGNLDAASVPLTWTVSQESGRYRLDCALPDGDWQGWTLDPTLTLQPDAAAGKDTGWNSGSPTYSATTMPWLDFNSGSYTAALWFDLSGLPAGAIVTAATLYLTNHGATNFAATGSLRRILAANAGWTEAATWNYAVPSTQRWAGDAGADGGADAGCSQSGTDYTATVMGSSSWASYEPGGTVHTIALDLTEFALMRAANHGMRLTTGYASKNVDSSDDAGAANRPKLVVDYTLPGGGNIFQSAIMHSAIYGGTLVR